MRPLALAAAWFAVSSDPGLEIKREMSIKVQDAVSQSNVYRLLDARYGPMLVNPNDKFIGRSFELYGEFSEGEVTLFRRLVKPGS